MWLLATGLERPAWHNHTSVTGSGMTSKCIVHAGVACRHVNLLGTACAPPASMREKTTITMMSITTAHTCVHLSPRAERCAPITRLTEHTSASGRPGACPPAPACAVTTTTCSRPSMAASARARAPTPACSTRFREERVSDPLPRSNGWTRKLYDRASYTSPVHSSASTRHESTISVERLWPRRLPTISVSCVRLTLQCVARARTPKLHLTGVRTSRAGAVQRWYADVKPSG